MSQDHRDPKDRGVSRRSFLRGLGTTAAAVGVLGCQKSPAPAAPAPETSAAPPDEPAAAPAGAAAAEGTVAVTLTVNGQKRSLKVEPRTTLLSALREQLGITGPKYVCGEGSCGACTVIYGDLPIYACLKLAVDAQDAPIRTVESFAPDAEAGKLHAVQQAFVDHDALQCGFCTSGFVTSVVHLVETNPAPSALAVKEACAGNVCRCGTYPRIVEAALTAAGARKGG